MLTIHAWIKIMQDRKMQSARLTQTDTQHQHNAKHHTASPHTKHKVKCH